MGLRYFKNNDFAMSCSLPADKYLILILCIALYHVPLICMVTFYTMLIIHIRKSSGSMNHLDSLKNDCNYPNNFSRMNNNNYQQQQHQNTNLSRNNPQKPSNHCYSNHHHHHHHQDYNHSHSRNNNSNNFDSVNLDETLRFKDKRNNAENSTQVYFFVKSFLINLIKF